MDDEGAQCKRPRDWLTPIEELNERAKHQTKVRLQIESWRIKRDEHGPYEIRIGR